jgi:hypothetical protein
MRRIIGTVCEERESVAENFALDRAAGYAPKGQPRFRENYLTAAALNWLAN